MSGMPRKGRLADTKNHTVLDVAKHEQRTEGEITQAALLRFVEILQGEDPDGVTHIRFKAVRKELTFSLDGTSYIHFRLANDQLTLTIISQSQASDVQTITFKKDTPKLEKLLQSWPGLSEERIFTLF